MFAVDEAVYTPNSTFKVKAHCDVSPLQNSVYLLYLQIGGSGTENDPYTQEVHAEKLTSTLSDARYSRAFDRNRIAIYTGSSSLGAGYHDNFVVRGRVQGLMGTHTKNNLITSVNSTGTVTSSVAQTNNIDCAFGIYESDGAGIIKNWYII